MMAPLLKCLPPEDKGLRSDLTQKALRTHVQTCNLGTGETETERYLVLADLPYQLSQ